ncbi:DUF6438 domain-containing protein [Sphingobium algorifonticola]|nr:DUF6438 domain-containing protein [Sphingobium algorifonticola]
MQGFQAAFIIMTLTGALAGCATTPAPSPVAMQGETIRFAAGRCMGACPVYSVTVEPDGSGVLVPEKHTSVPGETRFTVTPQQYRRLRDSLAPFRPATGTEKRIGAGDADCRRMATDMPSYQIRWTWRDQPRTQIDYYGGCHDPQNARLRAAIAAVPRMLDIEPMITPGSNTGKARS